MHMYRFSLSSLPFQYVHRFYVAMALSHVDYACMWFVYVGIYREFLLLFILIVAEKVVRFLSLFSHMCPMEISTIFHVQWQFMANDVTIFLLFFSIVFTANDK